MGVRCGAPRGEMGIIGHVGHETARRGCLGITSYQLLEVLTLEEVEGTGPISDDFEVRIRHGQLPETQYTAAVIDICGGMKGRLKGSGFAPGVEHLDDFAVRDTGADDATIKMRRRSEGSWSEKDVIALDSHAAIAFLID